MQLKTDTDDVVNGSWVEVLDVYKAAISEGRLSSNSWIDSTQGAECEYMTPHERRFIFGQATRYVDWDLATNPIRDWQNGDLKFPEEADEI